MLMRFLNSWADEKGELRLARIPAGTETASEAPTKNAKNQPVKSSSPKLCLQVHATLRVGWVGFVDFDLGFGSDCFLLEIYRAPMAPRPVVSSDPPEKIACDAIVVGAFSEGGVPVLEEAAAPIDSALDGSLTAYLTERDFKAKPGSIEIVPTFDRIGAKAVAVAGLGPKGDLTLPQLRKTAVAAARHLSDRTEIATTLGQQGAGATTAVIEGFLLGTYRYTRFKSDPHPSKIATIVLLDGDQGEIDRGVALAEATMLTRDLVNEPPNSLTPDVLARRAQEVADVNGLGCTVWDEAEIEKQGFGGLYSVGRGAINPPRFIQMHYAPKDASGKIALVGKGVTFDSGGLSLKPANSMENMKSDMTGAGAVIATMASLKRLDVKTEVIAFIPTTENLPSGDSLKPGDVIRHYNGKTTEVNNTDAEGRLILADALAFACEQKPDAIIDVATLTGGIMVALGTRISGLFANDDSLSDQLLAAAEAAGEPMWRMPLADEFRKDLDSDVADSKNSGPRWGSAIVGAIFLKDHVTDGIPWAHLDIAGTDWADKPHELGPKGSTGVMARTLINWLENLTR